jgi:hypothetical protein
MRFLELMDRRLIGVGFAANVVVWVIGLLVVGLDPSDAEMSWIGGLAVAAGFIVLMVVFEHDLRRRGKD